MYTKCKDIAGASANPVFLLQVEESLASLATTQLVEGAASAKVQLASNTPRSITSDSASDHARQQQSTQAGMCDAFGWTLYQATSRHVARPSAADTPASASWVDGEGACLTQDVAAGGVETKSVNSDADTNQDVAVCPQCRYDVMYCAVMCHNRSLHHWESSLVSYKRILLAEPAPTCQARYSTVV